MNACCLPSWTKYSNPSWLNSMPVNLLRSVNMYVLDCSPAHDDKEVIELTHGWQVSRLVREHLTKRAKFFNLMMDDVSITHLTFSPEFTHAVEAKQVPSFSQKMASVADKLMTGCSTNSSQSCILSWSGFTRKIRNYCSRKGWSSSSRVGRQSCETEQRFLVPSTTGSCKGYRESTGTEW